MVQPCPCRTWRMFGRLTVGSPSLEFGISVLLPPVEQDQSWVCLTSGAGQLQVVQSQSVAAMLFPVSLNPSLSAVPSLIPYSIFSTAFLSEAAMPQEIERSRRDNNNTPEHTEMDVEHSASATQTESTRLEFNNLPTEIHEAILDQLFGARGSLNAITPATSSTCSWSKSLRHPRRKILSDLALVCPAWRTLVQGRIYRHSQ